MKTIIKSTLMLIAAVLGISMTSCNSDSDVKDTVTTQSLSSCYAVVSDLENGGKTSLCTSVVIKLTLNWTTGRAEAGITGLVIGNQTYPQIVMKDIPWGFGDDNWGSAISATPTMETSASGITPAVTSFNLRWIDRMDFAPFVGTYDPGCSFSFIIDGRYHVIGSRQPFVFAGETTSSDPEGKTFSTLKPVYSVGLDFKTNMAIIAITNAQFVEGMPHMTMRFTDIPFEIKDGGSRIVLETNSLIPSVGESPQANFPISDLRATITPGAGMTLNFVCDYRKVKKYKVNANVDYTNYKDAIAGI